MRRVEFQCEGGWLLHSGAWLGYLAVLPVGDTNNTARSTVYIIIASLEALDAILFVSLEAPEFTTNRRRPDRNRVWVARMLSHVFMFASAVDRSNSTDDISGSLTDDANGSGRA